MEVDAEVVAQVRRRPRALLPGARGAAHRARLGRADRRLPHPPARDRRAARAARVGGVRLHGQRRRPVAPVRPHAGRALARPARGGDAAAVRGARAGARVPPEPLRIAGAAVLRRALVRKEAAEEQDRADPIARARAGLARATRRCWGCHIVR